jgi:hypothetical protein
MSDPQMPEATTVLYGRAQSTKSTLGDAGGPQRRAQQPFAVQAPRRFDACL